MRCPFCQNLDTSVIDSRCPESGSVIRRRRLCQRCGKRFTTFERISLALPSVIKRGGGRTEYSREKLTSSMTLALRKRPVAPERIDEAVDRIEQQMIMTGDREIRSSRIGELVLEELRRLDTIGYIRFASVYFNVDNPEAFIEMIHRAVAEHKGVLP